jgi:tetrahydromethanopterin S-methyltransferase subunit F
MPGAAMGVATRADVERTEDVIVGDASEKLKALLIERAARAGIGIYETGAGGFVVGMWSSCREVPDLRALHRCLGGLQ